MSEETLDTQALVTQTQSLVAAEKYAQEPEPVRAELYASVCQFLKGVKAWRAAIVAKHAERIAQAYERHRELTAARTREDESPARLEVRLKEMVLAYQGVDARIRRELEAKIAAEARAAEEAARLQEAAAIEATGDHEMAAAVLDAPMPPPPVVTLPPRKVAGIATKAMPKWRLTDPKKVLPMYLTPDTKKIDGIVRSLGVEAANVVGGIEVWLESSIASGKR